MRKEKDNDLKKYNNILYIEKESPLEELPENIKMMLSAEVFKETDCNLAINNSKSGFEDGVDNTDLRSAVEAMIKEAENAANGIGEYYTYDDIFGMAEEEQ